MLTEKKYPKCRYHIAYAKLMIFLMKGIVIDHLVLKILSNKSI